MRTCRSVEERQANLSEKLTRATTLLRTWVDVEVEQQNRDLLASMNNRARLQLRLQQTVEGLSVAAVSYYVVGLIGYLAKGVPAPRPCRRARTRHGGLRASGDSRASGGRVRRIRRSHKDTDVSPECEPPHRRVCRRRRQLVKRVLPVTAREGLPCPGSSCRSPMPRRCASATTSSPTCGSSCRARASSTRVAGMRVFESDGLTAYRQLPLVVVLPSTTAAGVAHPEILQRPQHPRRAARLGHVAVGRRAAAGRCRAARHEPLQPHPRDRPSQPRRRRAARRHQSRHHHRRRGARLLLRARSVLADRLLHRRQCRGEFRRRALPEIRPDRQQRARHRDGADERRRHPPRRQASRCAKATICSAS